LKNSTGKLFAFAYTL